MNIWLAPSAFYPHLGGIEELTSRLARCLTERGHRVAVVTHRWPATLPSEETVLGTHVWRIDMPPAGLHPARLMRYLAAREPARRGLDGMGLEFMPDLVHVIGLSWQAHHVAGWTTRRGVPLCVTTQGETVMDDSRMYQRGWKSALPIAALRSVARQANALTACSEWTRQRAAGLHGAFEKAVVIHNGVDVREFTGVGPVEESGPLLAYGRLVPNKGFDLLLKALRLIQRPLVIGGAGPEETNLRRAALDSGLPVTFVGPLSRPQVVSALAAASAVVMPSRVEPFGIVALEAMAAGRPVVASSRGGAGEFLAGGRLVDPFNSEELAQAVQEVSGRRDLGEEGRNAARALDWEIITTRYEETYAAMLS